MNILLFDMDGVLLEPHGYHRALSETVCLAAAALGFEPAGLSSTEIAVFESAGVSSEWDSSAICTALLLVQAWQVDTSARLPARLPAPQPPDSRLERPDFSGFATRLGDPGLRDLRPLERAQRLLLESENALDPAQREIVAALLANARAAENSLTHHTFQELVLGTPEYSKTYGATGLLNAPSYLLKYDLPVMSAAVHAALVDWLEAPGNRAAIFTARPSRPLDGVISPPEAELGARLTGLENLPIAGLGGLLWLAQGRLTAPQAFLKPSPVHVLAALALTLGLPLETALEQAAGLALDGTKTAFWNELHGARITAFEDTAGGLHSAATAAGLLAGHGVPTRLDLCGITPSPAKAQALGAVGAAIYPDINAALQARLL